MVCVVYVHVHMCAHVCVVYGCACMCVYVVCGMWCVVCGVYVCYRTEGELGLLPQVLGRPWVFSLLLAWSCPVMADWLVCPEDTPVSAF